MGCCVSHCKVKTVEVILDENGVARCVAEGKGTHFVHTWPDKRTTLQRKPYTKPSEISHLSRPQSAYYPAKKPTLGFPSNERKIYPSTNIVNREKELDQLDSKSLYI